MRRKIENEVAAGVGIRSLQEYRCIVLLTEDAENLAQLNLDRCYRQLKRDGSPRKPGKVWITIDRPLRERHLDVLREREREIVRGHITYSSRTTTTAATRVFFDGSCHGAHEWKLL